MENLQSTKEIIQNMNNERLDLLYNTLKIVRDKLEKMAQQKGITIPGIKSTGYVHPAHPERQAVVDHINGLVKEGNMAHAYTLYQKHLNPETAQNKLNYSEINRIVPQDGVNTLDYSKINAIKQQEPSGTLDYKAMKPQIKPADKPLDYEAIKEKPATQQVPSLDYSKMGKAEDKEEIKNAVPLGSVYDHKPKAHKPLPPNPFSSGHEDDGDESLDDMHRRLGIGPHTPKL